MSALQTWTQGAIAMGYVVVAMHFVRYWREARQPLFAFFSAGFFILAIHRTLFALTDNVTVAFSFRFAGYLIILIGVIVQRVSRTATGS